jgi:UDP-N-acetylglucosamine--N-acetylmuramyl-(pentapeptide) pyrophosphoryl-undecaprenol N-acetylglucosamine transferase
MKVIIVSSGAGGHLSCGLGIAEELKKRVPDSEIIFFGSSNKLVEKVVNEKGFKLYKIYSAGLTGRSILQIIKFVCYQIFGILQSGFLLFFIKPDKIISTGGFISTGTVLWSRIFCISCVVHEQNIIPGKANKLAGLFADRILVSFAETKKYFNVKKCVHTGMPMRFSTLLPKKSARKELGLNPDLFTVLVMGGSMGAHRINTVVIEALKLIEKDIQFIHLTGNEDFKSVKLAYEKYGFNAYVEAFSVRMDVIYSASDIAICRAGSGSLSEITFFGLPSILVPYPYSRDRHQYKNADFIEKNGAAIVVTEDKLLPNILAGLLNKEERKNVKEMAIKSREIAMPDAVKKIVDEIIK